MRTARYGVVQDVNLRAVGGMVAGNVERTVPWRVLGVHGKQNISHEVIHASHAWRRSSGCKEKRLLHLEIGRPACSLQGCSCESPSYHKRGPASSVPGI